MFPLITYESFKTTKKFTNDKKYSRKCDDLTEQIKKDPKIISAGSF
jgi:hypothetical protein